MSIFIFIFVGIILCHMTFKYISTENAKEAEEKRRKEQQPVIINCGGSKAFLPGAAKPKKKIEE